MDVNKLIKELDKYNLVLCSDSGEEHLLTLIEVRIESNRGNGIVGNTRKQTRYLTFISDEKPDELTESAT